LRALHALLRVLQKRGATLKKPSDRILDGTPFFRRKNVTIRGEKGGTRHFACLPRLIAAFAKQSAMGSLKAPVSQVDKNKCGCFPWCYVKEVSKKVKKGTHNIKKGALGTI